MGSLSIGSAHAFERLALPHEDMADAVGLATELDEPPMVDDAVDHGGDHLVVPEHRPPHLLNSRFVAITTDCLL